MNVHHPIQHVNRLFALSLLFSAALFLSACGGGGESGSSSADKLKEFSAQQVIKGPDGQEIVQMVYYAPKKMRFEQQTPVGKTVTIMRADKGVMWIINPDGQTYMEMKLDQDAMDAKSGIIRPETAGLKKVGSDSVEGFSCTKYEVPHGGGTVCMAEGVEVALKLEAPDGTTIFLRDIKTGGLDDSLFEIPEGLKKVSFPGMMMPPGSEAAGHEGGSGQMPQIPELPKDLKLPFGGN